MRPVPTPEFRAAISCIHNTRAEEDLLLAVVPLAAAHFLGAALRKLFHLALVNEHYFKLYLLVFYLVTHVEIDRCSTTSH